MLVPWVAPGRANYEAAIIADVAPDEGAAAALVVTARLENRSSQFSGPRLMTIHEAPRRRSSGERRPCWRLVAPLLTA
jgi:hypothetical protein